MLGQQVYSSIADVVNGRIDTHISLPADIAPGMYLVSVKSGTSSGVFHVSVNK
jgi:hypothetical protein